MSNATDAQVLAALATHARPASANEMYAVFGEEVATTGIEINIFD